MLPDNIFDAYTMLGNHGKLQKVYALLIYDKAWERKKNKHLQPYLWKCQRQAGW